MSSSIKLGESPQTIIAEVSAYEQQPLQPVERRGGATQLRRIIVLCEVFADLLTITLAVILASIIYESLAIGRQVHYPIRSVCAAASVVAIVMVLMWTALVPIEKVIVS